VPVREVAHNQLLRIGSLRRLARRRHVTGVLADDQRAREVFDHLASLLPMPFVGARVLELGPGRGTGLMRAALSAGVASYAAVDVAPYLTGDEVPEGIDYRVATDATLPWPDGSFDLVWSVSVLEHVREPEALLAEVHRVLRPGGFQVADLGLYDHYHARHDHDRMYQMLRYPSWLWDAMTSRRSSWTNRIRWSGWLTRFDDAGFSVVAVHERREPVDPAVFRTHRYLAHLSDDDLLVASADVVLQR
jgi:SAM-dependent methyltransferase